MKKYQASGCKPQSCPEGYYWRQDLCRCVKHLSVDSIKHPPSKNDLMVKKQMKKAKEAVNILQKNASSNIEKVKNLFGFNGKPKMKIGEAIKNVVNSAKKKKQQRKSKKSWGKGDYTF